MATLTTQRKPDEETAHAIRLYVLCKEFRQLPRPGGLYDQDYVDVLVLEAATEAHMEAKKVLSDRASRQNKSRRTP